jgi:ribosomal protein S18 acetylase RimI-like enzyme
MLLPKPIDLDCRSPDVTLDIYAVWQAAYRFEAKLLGVDCFPPLALKPIDLQQSDSMYRGIEILGRLVGAIGYEKIDDRCQITALIVLPQWHRRGIATALLIDLLVEVTSATVSTAAANYPAIALYNKFGFVEIDRMVTGAESIEIIHFQKTSSDKNQLPTILPLLEQ